MKKIKHQLLNKVTPKAREQQRIVQRNRDKSAEKTIQQLKQSIGSIQKMIQKSQQILRKTRPLNPRQVRSDSLQLKLNFNTQTKPNKNPFLTHKQPKQHLTHLSTTAITRTNTLNQSESQQNSIRNMMTNQNHNHNHNPNHKIKYNRPHLFIDTDHFNSEQGSDDKHSHRDNIFIYDSRSPVSTIVQKGVEDSFADSIESAIHFGRRLRTEAVNDSVERSLLDASIERGSVQRKSELPNRNREELPAKKIVLKRNKNLNLNHMRTLPQLQQHSKRQKLRIFATQAQKNPQKIKPGKYSYPNQNPQLYSNIASTAVNKRTEQNKKIFDYIYQSENAKKQNEQVTSSDRHSLSRRSPSKYQCQKFNKQNKYMEVQQFYGKVKKFGFVERYLSYNQIGCIYQYLKNSSIPYHKWPLYVVDKVYQKMQGLSRLKTLS